MEKKGDLIFWEISEVTTTKDKLAAMGFERFVPRNDFKSAMIKALRHITKGNDKLYRRFNDRSESVNFGVFIEEVGEDSISLNKELVIKVDKTHGNADYSAANHLADAIHDNYRTAKETLDAGQLRSLILKVVKHECYGFAMRSGGGIYFIDRRFEDTLGRLKELFSGFPEARLHIVPVYDDQGTVEALEEAVTMDVTGDINSLINDIDRRFKDGSITKRQLEGDKDRAQKIIEKMAVHKKHLRDRYMEVSNRLVGVQKAIEGVFTKVENELVEPEDFMNMLDSL